MPSTPAYAKTGWLNFDGLYGDAANGHPSLTEDEITDQYKRWFARRHDYSINGAQNYPLVSRLVDYFWNGVNYEGFGENCKLAHSGFPSILQLLNPDLGANPDFYELAEQHPALIYQVFTGGMIWQQLWNWGQWYEAEQHPVQSPFVGIWGSYTCDTMIMDIIAQKMKIDPISMQMWLMVDKPGIGSPPCKVINSIFNAGGTFAFDVVFKGGTFGEAADASTYKMNGPFSVLYGDPTMRFSAMTLQELTNSARLDTMQASLTTMQTALTKAQADIATIEAGGGGGGGGGPVIVVQSAIYFVTADHSRSVDVTSLVKAMRGPFSVYPGLLDAGGHPYDPFVGSQKTLRIQWTRDGVPRYVSYPDYHQTVDLTKD